MAKVKVPNPGYIPRDCDTLEQNGTRVSFIWYFTDKGRGIIETQYNTPAQIQQQLGVSRATAYRLVAAHPKRYWVSDMRDQDNLRCYCVLPAEVVMGIIPRPVGNPNLHNGMYQQSVARRLRKKRR